MALYIGLMSGTSLDGVDAVLASAAPAPLRSLAHVHRPYPAGLRDTLLALNRPGPDELHRAACAANAVALVYADAVADLLRASGHAPATVRALGAHGQTVRHRPGPDPATGQPGYSLQLLNGALLAERSGIDVICDFRSRDIAAGGQGAPLVPGFHAGCFARPGQDIAVLNLGGIANLSLLHADGRVGGFDCGPGNVLLDLWCSRHLGLPYDAGGAWALSGRVDPDLLQRALADPYFAAEPPKSTGRDHFHADWLEARLHTDAPTPSPADVMATLAALTAHAALDALQRFAPATRRLLVCGGGVHNQAVMRNLQSLQPPRTAPLSVASTAQEGIAPDQVEALAFAWLAQCYTQQRAGNRPEVTGARGPRVLGACYPAQAAPGS